MLSDLNSDPNIHVEILLIRVSLVDFFNASKYFIESSKYNNKFTAKFLFYGFLYFYFVVKISVAVSTFMNLYGKLIVVKI